MSSLDDKLRDLLRQPHQDSLGATVMSFPTQKTLDEIKQAFADEGYLKTTSPAQVYEAFGNSVLDKVYNNLERGLENK